MPKTATKQDLIVIGIDAEWVYREATDDNHILSYQYAGITDDGRWSGIICTADDRKESRLTLIELVGRAIEDGRKEKRISHRWPTTVYVAAHFSRADLSALKDYDKLRVSFDGVRKTFATVTHPYKARYNDASNNGHDLSIHLVDTMLLTPNGAGLAVLGYLYDLPKITLPDGMIERMDVLLATDRNLFERYAIRDAEISALHAWKMAAFVKSDFGESKPPATLGSLAVKHVQRIWEENGIQQAEVLGNEQVTERTWDSKKERFKTNTRDVPLVAVHDHTALATECFHGGRNEAYMFGFTELDSWSDFDLAGAYTTAMAAIRVPDYEATRVCYEADQYKADALGLARVRFKFPDATRYPCLPVRTDYGLLFPLEGRTHVASPEIELALDMGAEITVEHGVIIPWKSDVRPFELFSKSIRDHRQKHDKGSVDERTWKEIGNSLYGKLAQGLQRKRVFDNRSGDMKELEPSKITQPYLAAYTTSLVRAVLGEILHRVPVHKVIVSATTDGFLTNADEHDLNLTGPLCRLFSDLRMRLSNDPSILEKKHSAVQLLCWKTRGQASVDAIGQEAVPVIAKAGIKPPPDVIESARKEMEGGSDAEFDSAPDFWPEIRQTEYMLNLFVERTYDSRLPMSSLRSMRDMAYDDETDLTPVVGERRVNMEFDWKRQLVSPCERKAFLPWPHSNVHHLAADSVPWRSVDEFSEVRESFDRWRSDRKVVLKALADWWAWEEFRKTGKARAVGMNRTKEGLLGQVRRMFLRAYVLREWGLPGDDYQGISTHLTEKGFKTSVNDLKNAKRSKGDVLENAFGADAEVIRFIAAVVERHKEFEWRRLILEEDWGLVQESLRGDGNG